MTSTRPGKRFGNYRILRQLGKGGFARVYLGEHIHLENKAAIKVLRVELTEENQKEFLKEARTIASLAHPNIVRIREFDFEANAPYLVMDYAPNGTLRQRH